MLSEFLIDRVEAQQGEGEDHADCDRLQQYSDEAISVRRARQRQQGQGPANSKGRRRKKR